MKETGKVIYGECGGGEGNQSLMKEGLFELTVKTRKVRLPSLDDVGVDWRFSGTKLPLLFGFLEQCTNCS